MGQYRTVKLRYRYSERVEQNNTFAIYFALPWGGNEQVCVSKKKLGKASGLAGVVNVKNLDHRKKVKVDRRRDQRIN